MHGGKTMSLSIRRSWDEKRTQKRVRTERLIGVAVVPPRRLLPVKVKAPEFEACIHDISSGGLQIEIVTDRPLLAGTVLKIWSEAVFNCGLHTVELIGDVLWARRDQETGRQRLGIQLRDRPKKAIDIWRQDAFERIRNAAP
jgi:Ethanolamine utilization protein EutJ (predicted chaperonin)